MDTMEMLLKETKTSNRRRLWIMVILGLMLVVMITCAIILVPRAIETMNNVNALTVTYGTTAEKAQMLFEGMSEAEIQEVGLSMQKLSEFIQTVSGWVE